MILSLQELLNNYFLASPLDQFGDDDENVLSILDTSIFDSIPGAKFLDEIIDWSAISEFDSLSDWVALALGTNGVFTAILISEIVLAVACIVIFRKGKWKTTKV